jgi:hypothetical protein
MFGGMLYVMRHITSHVFNISNLACRFPVMVWQGHKKHKFSFTCSKGQNNPPEISLNLPYVLRSGVFVELEIFKKNCQQNTT